MPANRLFYFDALKALSIFSVVLGHTFLFVYKSSGYPIPTIVGWYQLTVFFLVSGYFVRWGHVNILSRCRLLIPFFFWGLLCQWMVSSDVDVVSFVTNSAKFGYWFLWTLLLFNLLSWFLHRCHCSVPVAALVGWLVFVVLHALFRSSPIGTSLTTDQGWLYWPSFIAGVWMKQAHGDRMDQHSLVTWIVCLPIALSMVCLSLLLPWDDYVFILKPLGAIGGMCLAILLFRIFRHAEQACKGVSFPGKRFIRWNGDLLGRYTLHIYVLHHFIIFNPNISWPFVHGSSLPTIAIVWMYILFAYILCLACVCVAKLVEHIGLSVLFGQR